MNKYIVKTLTAMMALTLTACSSDDDGLSAGSSQQEIRLIPVIQEAATRVLQTGTDIALVPGDKFYVWADQRDINVDDYKYCRETYFDEWELAVQNGVNQIAYAEEPMYYPKMNLVQFYAIHGNFSGTGSSVSSTDDVKSHFPVSQAQYAAIPINDKSDADVGPLLHNVETDQSTAANYSKSDLLYGIIPEMATSETAIPLNFHHMLSKIVVKLKKGDGLTSANLGTATIQLLGVKSRVLFTPKKLKFENGAVAAEASDATLLSSVYDLETLAVRAGMLSEPSYNPTTTILIGTSVDQEEVCILPPQTFVEGAIIKVIWSGKELTVPLTGTIRSGMKYTYEITVNHVGVNYGFTPTVSIWSDSGTEDIDVQ